MKLRLLITILSILLLMINIACSGSSKKEAERQAQAEKARIAEKIRLQDSIRYQDSIKLD